ncbi:hypothetical protein MLD38_035529 [Melastoma candidum]|uniref:Uncharacterized protein n=1 Tax=Melastoma candidum TaxID=119954 RepID=A0ACB9LGV3_9MYRT|nr:hypothetical protein MLD38_035529 [Melastoma candidum]
MADPAPIVRPVGGTEHSWCRAVPGGTGTTVLALSVSAPPDLAHLEKALQWIQASRPILRSRIRFDPTTAAFSFVVLPSPYVKIVSFGVDETSQILNGVPEAERSDLSPFHLILEHEMNVNPWRDFQTSVTEDGEPGDDIEVFFASVYSLSEGKRVLTLRLHTGACDRATAAALLRDLLRLVSGGGGGGGAELVCEEGSTTQVSSAIEDLIPSGKANKPFWARGVDLLGYSLNSFRFSNLDFVDAAGERRSQVLRLTLEAEDTQRLLQECESQGVKLCAVLAAAALIAAHLSKQLPDQQWQKYAVVTLVDCRTLLEPPLPKQHPGFYHSAIMNTHDLNGGEKLWDLARRTHGAFSGAKERNKHFSDMGDLNFLMCRALDNPGLTHSGSLRTALISVFEDVVIEESSPSHGDIGLQDYIGCASVHGIGPSIAIFDTIRDGRIDSACVYPHPLHTREQMRGLMDRMKAVLTGDDGDGGDDVD